MGMPAPDPMGYGVPYGGAYGGAAVVAAPERGTGPLVLVVGGAIAALLLMLAAYLGSVATPSPGPGLKDARPLPQQQAQRDGG
jgi:hypothetical protein